MKNNKRKLAKTNEKNLVHKISEQKVRAIADILGVTNVHPESIFHEVTKKLNGVDQEEASSIINAHTTKLTMATGVGSHKSIALSVDRDYAPLVISFAQQLVQEYECSTPSEKSLAEVAANAYVRIISTAEQLSTVKKVREPSNLQTNWYAMLSKELDRAERHFFTALSSLKQLRLPSVSVNIKTKAAFVAEQQQFNNSDAHNDT